MTTVFSYSSITSSKWKFVNKSVSRNTETKVYQFKLEVGVMKDVNVGERTGLNRVFEERVRNMARYDFQ